MPCISVPTAMLVSGGLAAAGGVASAVIGGSAAKSAAQVQAAAAKSAADSEMAMFDKTSEFLKPFREAGVNSLGGLSDYLGEAKNLVGLGTGGTAGIMTQLEQMPGYQFALKQGLQATQNGYAAKGLGSSGAAMKGAADYAEGLAGTNYQSLFGNVLSAGNYNLSVANLGENAAAQVGQQGLEAQAQANALNTSGAAATAGGTVGAANAAINGLGAITGAGSNTALLLALQNAGMFGPVGAGAAPGPSNGAGHYF